MKVNKASNQGTGLTGRAALLAVANSLAFAMAFMLPLVLVRTLNQSEFGLYKQAFQIVTTALALLGLHVSTTAFYFMPRHPDKKPQIVLNVLIFYFAVGAVLALLFLVHPQWVTVIFKSDDLAPHIPILGLAILLWLVSSFLEIVTVADGHIRAATVFIVLVQLSKSLLLIGAGLAFGSIRALLVAAVIQGALQCVILFTYLYRRFGVFWKSFDARLLKAQLANALPFGFGGLVVSLQMDLNKYFVSHYFDPADFAIYSVGCFQIPLMMVLVDSVSSVLIPEVARLEMEGNYKKIIALWMAVIRKLALFFVPTVVALLILRHEFITALFTKDYAAAAPIFADKSGGLFADDHGDGACAARVRGFQVLQAEALHLPDPCDVRGAVCRHTHGGSCGRDCGRCFDPVAGNHNDDGHHSAAAANEDKRPQVTRAGDENPGRGRCGGACGIGREAPACRCAPVCGAGSLFSSFWSRLSCDGSSYGGGHGRRES